MMARYFQFPFAENGDRQPIPDESVTEEVNYENGYTPAYELEKDNPDRRNIDRQPFNSILFDITDNLKFWQENGAPEIVDGVSYGVGFVGIQGGSRYRAIVDGTSTLPPSSEWELVAAGPYSSKDIGEPFGIWDHLPGVPAPDNSGSMKFVRLTAGQSGAGGYNEGLIENEDVSGTAPNVSATADLSVGPAAGGSIRLINTEERFLRAGPSGRSQDGQIESHNHSGSMFPSGSHNHTQGFPDASDNVSYGGETGTSRRRRDGADASTFYPYTSTAPDHTHTMLINSTGGDETRPRNISATYYVRIV